MEGGGHELIQDTIWHLFGRTERSRKTPVGIFVSRLSYSDALDQSRNSSIFSPTEDRNGKFQNVILI
jgi:hypothetical protein